MSSERPQTSPVDWTYELRGEISPVFQYLVIKEELPYFVRQAVKSVQSSVGQITPRLAQDAAAMIERLKVYPASAMEISAFRGSKKIILFKAWDYDSMAILQAPVSQIDGVSGIPDIILAEAIDFGSEKEPADLDAFIGFFTEMGFSFYDTYKKMMQDGRSVLERTRRIPEEDIPRTNSLPSPLVRLSISSEVEVLTHDPNFDNLQIEEVISLGSPQYVYTSAKPILTPTTTSHELFDERLKIQDLIRDAVAAYNRVNLRKTW